MIIGISGKKGHGKDTVAKIIQYFIYYKKRGIKDDDISFILDALQDKSLDLKLLELHSGWYNKKFAYKLKQIVCILIDCTMEQLEDEEFKNKELGEEWWVIEGYADTDCKIRSKEPLIPYSEENWKALFTVWKTLFTMRGASKNYVLVKTTPRLLLQLLGTECGRQIIHPNIWINSLMSEYMEDVGYSYEVERVGEDAVKIISEPIRHSNGYPNWIISDVRFPDEAKSIKDKGGYIIKVNNPRVGWTGEHKSETAMDNYKECNYLIGNEGDINNLIRQVEGFLKDIKLI